MTVESRGTSNTNDRGSAEARRARKLWLLDVYGADVDVVTPRELEDLDEAILGSVLESAFDPRIGYWADLDIQTGYFMVPKGLGQSACRCYRCGKLLAYETMEVDRIVPGCMKTPKYPNGGTYVRENIRPACPNCNKVTGNEAKAIKAAKRKKRNEQARARRAAA